MEWVPANRTSPGGPPAAPVLDGASIVAAAEAELRRLRTDTLDLMQLHWPDRYVPGFGRYQYRLDAARQAELGAAAGGAPVASFEQQAEALGGLLREGKGDLAEVCAPHHLNLGLLPWSAAPAEQRRQAGRHEAAHRTPKLACVESILKGLPKELEPFDIADDLARQRPLLNFDDMRAFVTSRLQQAGAEVEVLASVSADLAAIDQRLGELRTDLCVDGAFASGAELAAHLDAQLSRRVGVRGKVLYSGGCCALDAMRHMATVRVYEEDSAFFRLAGTGDGLGNHVGQGYTAGKLLTAGITSLAEAMECTTTAMQGSEGVDDVASSFKCLDHGNMIIKRTMPFMTPAFGVLERLRLAAEVLKPIMDNHDRVRQEEAQDPRIMQLPVPQANAQAPLRADARAGGQANAQAEPQAGAQADARAPVQAGGQRDTQADARAPPQAGGQDNAQADARARKRRRTQASGDAVDGDAE